MVVNSSHSRTKPTSAPVDDRRVGRRQAVPPPPPPPEPPKRSRFLRRKSSSELTVAGPVAGGRRRAWAARPTGPWAAGGSSPRGLPPDPPPLPDPHGPLLSANKARAPRSPAPEYAHALHNRVARRTKNSAAGRKADYGRGAWPMTDPLAGAVRPSRRRAHPLAQAQGRHRRAGRRCQRAGARRARRARGAAAARRRWRIPGVDEARIALTASRPERKIVAIGSGKGGVGKSTLAANLAVALARMGKRVGHDRRRHLRPVAADPARRPRAAAGREARS